MIRARFLKAAVCLIGLATTAEAGTIALEIRHLWKGEPLAIPSPEITTKSGETISVTRLSYLLSEPRLRISASDKWVGREDWFAFVDSGENEISTLTLGGVPDGKYSALQLHVGLDAETDASDPNRYGPRHPLNPLVNNLYWTPQQGYIFLALEGRAGESGFSYHLGHARNRVALTLPVEIDLQGAARVSLDFHVDRLLDEIETRKQSSTHSREGDPLAARLKQLLGGAFEVRGVRGSGVVTAPKSENGSEAGSVELVGTPYAFTIKRGFPIPNLPTDFPLTNERVTLGRELFHETRLSRTDEISCASCHQTERAFSDPKQFSVGVEGRTGRRNSMTLFNLAWKNSFFWDGRAASLREQALIPIEDHLEMDETLENVVRKLGEESRYSEFFESAFGDAEITPERIGVAIEQFILTLTSINSRFDRAMRGETQLTELEQRGFMLFNTEFDPRRRQFGADCFHCHGGALFSDFQFHDNGLELTKDLGLGGFTEKETDNGKFSTPSLRNIALTAPYMHDGRFETLEEVVAHYAGGVRRNPNLDPNLAKHPDGGVPLNEEDQAALVAFLKTLTDERFGNPD